MSVLITGITGFVGKNFNQYLKKNSDLDIRTIDLRGPFELMLQHDITSVVHLVGKAHDLKKTSSPDEYFEVNYQLTKKMYDAFLASNASQFIYMSSVKAAADQVDGELIETHVPNPQTVYGKSKLMAEEYIMKQDLPAGKSYYILRPCMIHGPGNKGNLNLLYKLVEMGIPYPLAGFDNQRSFLSVENLSFLLKEIIVRKDLPSGIYNVSDDQPLATTEVVCLLAKTTPSGKASLLRISPNLIRGLARWGDVLHLPLNTERLTKLTESYVVSNTKIKKWLNKSFPLDSSAGIVHTASSFLKNT